MKRTSLMISTWLAVATLLGGAYFFTNDPNIQSSSETEAPSAPQTEPDQPIPVPEPTPPKETSPVPTVAWVVCGTVEYFGSLRSVGNNNFLITQVDGTVWQINTGQCKVHEIYFK